MKRWSTSAGLLLACACSQPDSTPGSSAGPQPLSSAAASAGVQSPDPAATAVPTPAPAEGGTPVASLAGEWRVAGINGKAFEADYALTLSASPGAIDFSPDCAGADRQYAIDGLAIRTWIADADRNRPVCEIGLPEGTIQMWRAIDAAIRVERTQSNGVLLSGGEYSLLLFSQ